MEAAMQGGQILWMLVEDFVVDGHRAADCTFAAFLRGAQANQPDDICDVAMGPQLGGAHAAPVFALGIIETVVADFLDQFALDVLRLGGADMLSDPPIAAPDIGIVVALDGETAH